MPDIYRIIEICVYSLLNFLPFLALALYPFRHSLRFSEKVTGLLIVVLTAVQLILGVWAAFFENNNAGLISMVSTLLYAGFYFLAIKAHPGKTLFTLLMISNIANFTVMAAKCLEGQLFPLLAVQSYRWSFSLLMLLVEAVIGIPLFHYVKYMYAPAVAMEGDHREWNYLWLIPATFYLIWYYAIYGNSATSSLEIALRPDNALFFFVINIGAILVYYVVSRLILEQNKTMELKENNHRLTMQAMQYENLQEKITEARRAKHDIHHHITLMQEYLKNHDYTAAEEYLNRYRQRLPDDSLICFCKNSAVNAVLLYFAQQAKRNGIDYIVKVDVNESIGIDDADLSVLFGNLVENAVDACRMEKVNDRKIIIRAKADENSLCVTVDNTFSGTLQKTADGMLISTKHSGMGLGTESVKSIVKKHSGICKFEAKNGIFYASVICFVQH